MKKVKMFVHEPSINNLLGREFSLLLNENAHIIDAIDEVDKVIKRKGRFPVLQYGSLLHMVYNPVENRFYEQVAVSAHKQSGQMLNLRANPTQELPDGITIVLIPAGGCISKWEEAIDYMKFLSTMSKAST